MDDELLLIAVVEMVAGHEEAGCRYEDNVLALLGRHGGTLDWRYRGTDGTVEVQAIRFATRAGLDTFLADPDRSAYRIEAATGAPATRVIEATRVA